MNRPAQLRLFLASLTLTICGLALIPHVANAQVAGTNVNMVSGTKWPGGDPFLQRQNEPSMAVSTRNPLHILAGANDYRTVDLELALSGGAETGDSWLGLFKSFDGGLTWQSTLLPGCPYVVSQCTDSGALGGAYQAASDPVVRAGTNGMFYYAGLAFDRATSATTASSISSIFVARYNDLNNNENVDPITYIDTHIVATGNSTQFLDKPALAVDIPRSRAGTCSFNANEPGTGPNGGTLSVAQSFAAGNVYIAYTDFLQATKANSTPTHLMFSRSTDCGVTWSAPVQINTGTTTSQGSAIAIDSLNGNVYVAWRQFASTGVSDAIMVAQSTNAGKSFSAPVQISTFQPFDQGTTGTSFRTNAYPSITTDMFGFVYVAFSARGVSTSGDARVVAAGSIDGTHWTPAIMVDNPTLNAQTNPSGRGHQIMPAITFANGRLTILYYDLRLDHYANSYTANVVSPTGYNATLVPEGELAPPSPTPSKVFNTFIDDSGLTLRRHTLDLRVLELGIFPTIVLGPSVLVSSYAYGCCINPNLPDIEQFKFNVPNLPLFAQGQEPFLGDYIDIVPSPLFVPNGSGWAYNFTPSVNPLFHATWTDNRDVVPPLDGDWTHYTPAIPPGTGSVFQPGDTVARCMNGQEGMRDQNIYTAQITGGLVVGAPGNAKQLGTTVFNNQTVPFQRAFAVEAQNVTSQQIFVRFSIANQPTGGAASFLQFSQLTTLDVTIPAFSSVSRSVFVTSTNAEASVTVNVTQISSIGGSTVTNGLSSSAVLNPDITNPNITNPNITNPNITNPNITNFEVTDPNITNPNITNPNITNPNITNPDITNPNITNPNITNVSATNPNITNPNITNPDITNPNITNPNITNPDITNGSIQDVVYPITNNGNTTATYTVKLASNGVPPNGVVLQLILNKLYQTPVAITCQLTTETHWVTVANITNPKLFTAADPQLGNPDITNSAPNEASITLAPGETAYIDLRVAIPVGVQFNPVTAITPVTIPQAVDTQTVLANPGNTGLTGPATFPPLTILTTTLPATDRNDAGYSVQLLASGGKPGTDTWSIVGGALPPGINLGPSGLVSGTATTPGSFTATIQVADTASPQHTSLQVLTLNVSVTPLTEQFVLTPPDGVVGQSYVASPLAVTGGTTPYTWTVQGLPPGLGINSTTGQITGSPLAANPGGSNVTITATDAAAPAESVSFNTTIRVGAVIQISPASLPSGTIDISYTTQLSATGGIGGLVFGPPGLPGGGTMDSTGLITFTNPQTSSVSFTASVHDQANPNQFATANYTILFAPGASANITFTSQPPNYVGGQPNPNSPVVVHVADNTNAPIANANVTMSLNGTPPCPTAVLGGTLTAQTNATGDASFTLLTIDRGQIGYRMQANVQAQFAVSNPFTVNGFCATGNSNSTRYGQTSTLLNDGTVLLTGGVIDQTPTPTNAAEIFNPATGAFTAITPGLGTARFGHTATLLSDGRVLIAGGAAQGGSALATAEIYDPSLGTFSATVGTMANTRLAHTATLLTDGTVLIAGGTNGDITAGAELFIPATGMFSTISSTMNSKRELHTATLLANGKVLIAGGLTTSVGGNVVTATAEIYDPVSQTFTNTITAMNAARDVHTATLLGNGLVLIAGGQQTNGTPIASAELFDPSTGSFSNTGSLTAARGQHTATLLVDGTVLVAGGTATGTTSAEVYDPTAQTFSVTGTMISARFGHTATLLNDGTVLVANGSSSTNAFQNTAEIYYSTSPLGPLSLFPLNPVAIAGVPYTQFLKETGGVGHVTWSLQAGPLPSGINLNSSNGLLSGTTSSTGAFPLIVTVTDSSTPAKSVAFHVTLTVVPQLVVTTTSLPNGTEGVPYTATINTTGGTPPIFFSVTQASFPPGLTITQPATGMTSDTLTGTPTAAGTFIFFEGVADSGSPMQTAQSVNYMVKIVPQPPTNAAPGSPVGTIIWEFSLSGDVTGYNVYRSTVSGGPYTLLTATPLPATAFSFTDNTVQSATTYFYVVTAVAPGPTESVFSNQVTVVVP